MYEYEYTGGSEGIMTFEIDGKRYTVAKNHPTLPEVIELPKKVNILGLKLKEQETKRKSKKKTEGDE